MDIYCKMFRISCRSKQFYSTFSKLPKLENEKFEIDFDYICNENFFNEIEDNIKSRKGVGNINNVIKIYKNLLSEQHKNEAIQINNLLNQFYREAKNIPNKTHPNVKLYGNSPKVVKFINNKPEYGNFKPYEFIDIVKKLNILRTEHLGHITGNRSYYFINELANMEEALIKYSVKNLIEKGFQLISVPDILPKNIIESCGMATDGERSQIYKLDPLHYDSELCLSGTAEMSIAAYLSDTIHNFNELPLKLAAVSRCYRAEISNVIEQRGIYRVHQFTKVEMFGATIPEQSENMLEEFRSIEEELFKNLGLHMRVLDMPPHELGAPAYRKYDIEAWMPGRNMYGEISSCSNCTDYQSRRLNIKYLPNESSIPLHVHTLNGTACAVPRMLIAILETHQHPDKKISIPQCLQQYMQNKEYISYNPLVPFLKLTKLKM